MAVIWHKVGVEHLLGAYIKKIAYYLPEKIELNPLDRLTKKTGIRCRHIADQDETGADLAVQAAEALFQQGLFRDEIDYILLCTQSPDFILPTTACILQNKLRLRKSCGALDFNLGCSGYVYGLSLAKGLIESGQAQKILLLTAETYSKYIHPEDYSVKPLFGDAATATLIEKIENQESGIHSVVVGTDGDGYENLIVPVGGMRKRFDHTEIPATKDRYGNIRTALNLQMNGAAISEFALEVVPAVVSEILTKCDLEKTDVDYFVFHQANQFMLRFLQEKCELLDCPFWNDVEEYGNTVSNSIPIALVDMLKQERKKSMNRVMLVGFGVGLSWGGCMVNLSKIE